MDITITIPTDRVPAVIDAFATQYNYQETITDEQGNEVANPTTKAQFALAAIKSFIKEVYIAGVATQLDTLRGDALATAATEIDGVSVS